MSQNAKEDVEVVAITVEEGSEKKKDVTCFQMLICCSTSSLFVILGLLLMPVVYKLFMVLCQLYGDYLQYVETDMFKTILNNVFSYCSPLGEGFGYF